MSTVKFEFSEKLAKRLSKAGADYFDTLHAACQEAAEAGVSARDFPAHLRGAGFPCSTGSARAAYKAVREGADLKAMVAAVNAVKARRKTDKAADKTADKTADKEPDTLVGALEAALHAAEKGNLAVVETWLAKANAILATAKKTTAQAIEKMGGIVAKAS